MAFHDFLPNWMIFFHLSFTWWNDFYITKNCVFGWYKQQLKNENLMFFSITEQPFRYQFVDAVFNQERLLNSPSTTLSILMPKYSNLIHINSVITFFDCKLSSDCAIVYVYPSMANKTLFEIGWLGAVTIQEKGSCKKM